MTKLPKHTRISVVLLNYNGGETVERCIRSFTQQTVLPERVLFVDNGSELFDEHEIRSRFGDRYESVLGFLRLEKNLGYVKGMNRGIERVLSDENGPEWVMTLSNDTELDAHFFEKLGHALRALERAVAPGSLVGMLGPKIKSQNAPHMLDATGISLSLDGMSTARGQREPDENQYDLDTHILIPNGVSAIYRVNLLKDVGLMDEAFSAYCEDTDLGLRAWMAGWDCRFLPECIVYHARSSTYGEHSLSKLYQVERNHYWVAVKNLPLPLLALNPTLSLYRYFVQMYAVMAGRGQGQGYGDNHSPFDLAKATIRGVIDAGIGLPSALRQRLRLRRLRRRSTLEVLFTLWKKRLKFDELILK